nr:alanine racemase [Treponema sp.]
YFKHNLAQIRALLHTQTKICISVKADAYGHGAVAMAKAALTSGASYLAVATVDEGIELRAHDITCPVLVLSLCSPQEVSAVVENDLTPLVFDTEYIDLFDKAAASKSNPFVVHLAMDTGMGRIGCLPEEAADMAAYIDSRPHLKLGGVATHFAVSDSISEEHKNYTQLQYTRFHDAIEAIKQRGIDPGICHCSSSAAIISRATMQMDMVRAGIIAYGYYPDQITKSYLEEQGIKIDLKPVLTFESAVVAVRPFTAGRSVSYGRTWIATSDTDIAVLPVGYADGLLRRLSPGLQVAINGKNYPVRGRICMDQCMVDIGKNNPNVKRWDTVVIFGNKDDGALQTADDVAASLGTISYEVLTGLSKRVPRVYIS